MKDLNKEALYSTRWISKLLGGDAWKSQPIAKLGTIQSKSYQPLNKLEVAVKASIASQSVIEGAGLFNSNLVKALVRAFHERQSTGPSAFFLRSDDYQRAAELLQEPRTSGGQSGICFGHLIFQH